MGKLPDNGRLPNPLVRSALRQIFEAVCVTGFAISSARFLISELEDCLVILIEVAFLFLYCK